MVIDGLMIKLLWYFGYICDQTFWYLGKILLISRSNSKFISLLSWLFWQLNSHLIHESEPFLFRKGQWICGSKLAVIIMPQSRISSEDNGLFTVIYSDNSMKEMFPNVWLLISVIWGGETFRSGIYQTKILLICGKQHPYNLNVPTAMIGHNPEGIPKNPLV
jgi:hypothetical protein